MSGTAHKTPECHPRGRQSCFENDAYGGCLASEIGSEYNERRWGILRRASTRSNRGPAREAFQGAYSGNAPTLLLSPAATASRPVPCDIFPSSHATGLIGAYINIVTVRVFVSSRFVLRRARIDRTILPPFCYAPTRANAPMRCGNQRPGPVDLDRFARSADQTGLGRNLAGDPGGLSGLDGPPG
ncbi:hypothetical protein CSOJ01_13634 [Colletotrichum sojae]|uniref:Uncharacterized protein n=1 Tax=Colletotrichum sojae TaxID=2175907 RepID=A0A8H6ISH3_9PEZI|nr:hypothetical protein CSOJ01_13634 [Colletotrichum sojae]